MQHFTLLESEYVVTIVRCVYRQAKLYHHDKDLYATYGSGVGKLLGHGDSSNPKVKWEGLTAAVYVDVFGRPFIPEIKLERAARARELAAHHAAGRPLGKLGGTA